VLWHISAPHTPIRAACELSTCVDEDVAAKLKRLADEKEWTPSKYLEKLIRAHVEAKDAKAGKPQRGTK
jgi:hypothetical protein